MLRLERMEICGFKSFSDRTELTFPEGITGVVGPNGCGKSNIGDAINWVLGEQSPRMLRGRQMADVIFNGTESRKPLGLAEVTVVFGGAEGLPHAEQGRVHITRRLFRSGESEYRLNGARARLMDIQELLRSARVGARTYATIEQGRIDQVLNAKPKERRALIEDAAGVSGYKHKRRLAELKLEATQANLLRVHDIHLEVERQINALKRQAAKARRYRRLREELRRREALRFARQAFELDRELGRLRERERASQAAEAEGAARLGRLEAQTVAARERLETVRRERLALSERQHECEIEIDRAAARAEACRERIRESEAAAGQHRDDAAALAARLADAETRAVRQRAALAELRSAQEGLRGEAEREAAELERLERERRRLREEIEELRARQFETMSQAAELRNRRRSIEEAIERGGRRRDRLTAELTAAEAAAAGTRAETEARAAEAATLESEHERASAGLRERESLAREARATLEDGLARLSAAREAEQSAAARVSTLDDVGTRFTGVSDGVRALLAAEPSRGIRTRGVVADYVDATREIESAAESYLQWLLPAVILEDDGDARRAAALLRESGAGRTALISRDHPAGAPAVGGPHNGRSAVPVELLRDARVLGRLRDKLTLRAAANGAVAERIGDAVLVDNLESALDLHRAHPGLDYLTSDGDVVYSSGVIATGGRRESDHGLLAHRRRLEQARVEVAAAAALAGGLQSEADAARRQLERAESALDAARTELERVERGRVEIRLSARQLAAESVEVARRAAALAEELAALRAEADPLAGEIERALAASRAAEERHALTEQALGASVAAHAAIEPRLETQLERVAELRERAGTASERQAAAESESRILEEQLVELAERRARLEGGATSFIARAQEAGALLAATEADLALRIAERERLQAAGAERDREIVETEAALGGIERDAREARTTIDELRASTREAEMSRTRAEVAREHLDDLCVKELETTASAALAAAAEIETLDLAAVEAEIVEIREAIERIGPVNMTAIEEFAELEERHAFLGAQRADLAGSMESLRESIRRIDRQSRQRFEEAFEAIRASYQETYKLLFSGGRADLRLEEGEDVLECGIEILAQPPGKRLAGVHLLSGGEKALSAIALLFAIFRFQPSPFCLLDEVDAALDDANVGRFMRMVREYARNTQFLVVTHNKLSMEAANLLYGVTMEERGVSRIVSLQLQ